MNLKVTIFVAFAIINKGTSQNAECQHENRWYTSTGIRAINDTYYSCILNTKQADFDQELIKIQGQHETDHNDDDVKLLLISNDNKLKNFTSIFCQKFPNLVIIYGGNADIELFNEDSLSNCKNLENLEINNNKFRNVPENLLTKNAKMTKLYMWNNQLTTLPEYLLANQKDLKELKLNENKINFLPDHIFRSLVKLELLYLSDNKLESINTKWFANFYSLKLLALNGNQILEIPSKAFASLRRLDILWLFDNKINTLNSDSFDGLQNLQILTLYVNEISDLPVDVFSPLKNLQELSMRNNKLTTIHSDSFGVLNKLERVNLQNNKIIAIDEKFINNTEISLISMKNNICSQIFTTTKSEIKPNLKICFDNYQPRYFQLAYTNKVQSSSVCGKTKAGRGNIIGGTQINSGDYPWNAALLTPNGKYFCGGTLISNHKVISAAHCIHEKKSSIRLTASDIIVLLGAHDLDNSIEIGRAFHAIYSITIYPDWNTLTQSFDADISVLVLEKEVVFNQHVQPICLAFPNSNTSSIATGSVIGYGKSEDETKIHENIPKILTTPIHSNRDCFADNDDLALISSGRTFCGGSGRGVGVCTGDSGSGLIVNDGTAFYLRGIVSSSLINAKRGCDVDTYAVFTDVTKYIDWINGISTSRFK